MLYVRLWPTIFLLVFFQAAVKTRPVLNSNTRSVWDVWSPFLHDVKRCTLLLIAFSSLRPQKIQTKSYKLLTRFLAPLAFSPPLVIKSPFLRLAKRTTLARNFEQIRYFTFLLIVVAFQKFEKVILKKVYRNDDIKMMYDIKKYKKILNRLR